MSILVTGANGFVGRALCQRLRDDGRDVIAGVRRKPTNAHPCGRVLGDLSTAAEAELVAALHDVDVIVHLAGRAHITNETAADSLAAFRRVNVDATRRLAQAAVATGVRRLVFVSSIKVNGERTQRRPFRADDIPAPIDAYGWSKLEAEQCLRELAATSELEVVIVRPPLIYGPGAKGNLARLADWIRRGVPLPLGAVDNRRSLVGLHNLCDLLIACTAHPAATGRTFLVSDGDDVSTPQLIQRMAAAMGQPARLVPIPVPLLAIGARLARRQAEFERLCGSLQIDMAATRSALQWNPPVSLDDGLRRMFVS